MFTFYYSQLNSIEKKIYNQYLSTLKEKKNTFIVTGNIKEENLLRSRDALFFDHAEICEQSNAMSYMFLGNMLKVELDYYFSIEDIKKYEQEIIASVINNFKFLKMLSSDYDKLKYIHDYFCNHVTYDLEEENAFNILGPLLKNRGVCQGVAMSVKLICDYLKIKCYIAYGTLKKDDGEEGHAWNVVNINDNWYHLDLTNDLNNYQFSLVSYDYFLISDSDIYKTHTPTKDFKMMPCIDNKLNYYYMNHIAFNSLSKAVDYINNAFKSRDVVRFRLLSNDEKDYFTRIFTRIKLTSYQSMKLEYVFNKHLNTYTVKI